MADNSSNDRPYSRDNPSPQSIELLKQYEIFHSQQEKETKKVNYPGRSLYPHIETIQNIIQMTGSKTVLDYGAGKGRQYHDVWVKKKRGAIIGKIPTYWQSDVTPWDPNYGPLSKMPEKTFDCVISTDVLEHIPDTDLGWVVDEIMSFAEKVVFINIGNYPASAILPNGMNAHVTVRPTEWWQELIEAQAAKHPHLKYVVRVSHKKGHNWDDISNFDWVRPEESVGIIPAGILPAAIYYMKKIFSR